MTKLGQNLRKSCVHDNGNSCYRTFGITNSIIINISFASCKLNTFEACKILSICLFDYVTGMNKYIAMYVAVLQLLF